jgi:hypothetical protein
MQPAIFSLEVNLKRQLREGTTAISLNEGTPPTLIIFFFWQM